jgi:HCOMODA/2-hydroxy-3-carboxy-muconic semialdehyde decarboxylase
VIANRILAREEVVDAYGHVSVRHPDDPGRFLIARSACVLKARPDTCFG